MLSKMKKEMSVQVAHDWPWKRWVDEHVGERTAPCSRDEVASS